MHLLQYEKKHRFLKIYFGKYFFKVDHLKEIFLLTKFIEHEIIEMIIENRNSGTTISRTGVTTNIRTGATTNSRTDATTNASAGLVQLELLILTSMLLS